MADSELVSVSQNDLEQGEQSHEQSNEQLKEQPIHSPTYTKHEDGEVTPDGSNNQSTSDQLNESVKNEHDSNNPNITTNQSLDQSTTQSVDKPIVYQSPVEDDIHARSIYVENLPFQSNEQSIRSHFEPFGGVITEIVVALRRDTRLPAGYAFLRYSTPQDASRIALAANNTNMGGRLIRTNIAKPKKNDQQSSNQSASDKAKLFVSGFPATWSQTELEQKFAVHGDLVETKILQDRFGVPRGCGFVRYAKPEAAIQAISQLNNTQASADSLIKLQVRYAREDSHQHHNPNHNQGFHQLQPFAQSPMYNPQVYQPVLPQQPFSYPPNMAYQDPYQQQQQFSQSMNRQSGYGPARPNFQQYRATSRHDPMSMNAQQNNPYAPQTREPIVFVMYLPGEVAEADLTVLFGRFGPITRVEIPRNRTTGESKGFGFIHFHEEKDALQAIAQMDGYAMGHKRLKVQHRDTNPRQR